jgi:ABC-type branched-subunit amino acid transport system ATPase component
MTSALPHSLSVPASTQHPAVEATIGRVTVILGANGTGKSALLNSIRGGPARLMGFEQARRVDARRVMQVTGHSALARNQVGDNVAQHAHSLLEAYAPDQSKHQVAAARLLEALCHEDRRLHLAYAKQCDELVKAGRNTELRPRPSSPLDAFRELYARVLPDIGLSFDTSSVTLTITKTGGVSYGPESLSSGEQQIFLLLGKFIFDHPKTLFLVDEPELNLNPRLAEKFWETIEQRHPHCAFIYVTHALHFALRPGVDRALVLTRSGAIPLDASSEFLELAREDREQFLGSIPSVVLASRVLFTEGGPDSIDRSLYSYLLSDSTIKVEPIGSRDEVEKAVAGRQGWEAFTRGADVAGVVDADYKTERDFARLNGLRVFVLPLHEAESLLCLPDAVECLSRAMHSEVGHVSAADVLGALANRLRAHRLSIAVKRASESVRVQYAPSLTAELCAKLSSDDEVALAFRAQGEAQLQFLKEHDLHALFLAELRRIDEAIERPDATTVLKLLPGKALANQICSMLRIPLGAMNLLSYYQKHCPPDSVPMFRQVRTDLKRLFSEPARTGEPLTEG